MFRLPTAPQGADPFFMVGFFEKPIERAEGEPFWWVQCVGMGNIVPMPHGPKELPEGWRVLQALHPETEKPIGDEFYCLLKNEKRAIARVCEMLRTPKIQVTTRVRVPPVDFVILPYEAVIPDDQVQKQDEQK